ASQRWSPSTNGKEREIEVLLGEVGHPRGQARVAREVDRVAASEDVAERHRPRPERWTEAAVPCIGCLDSDRSERPGITWRQLNGGSMTRGAQQWTAAKRRDNGYFAP